MSPEAITLSSVSWALDAAALRQRVIAGNLAHASAIGHVPQRVEFDEQIANVQRQMQEQGRLDPASLSSLLSSTVTLQPVPIGDDAVGGSALDAQMVDMASNALHYQALVKGLSRHMGILSLAVSEGKR